MQHSVDQVVFTHKPHPRSKSIKIRVESTGEIVVSSPPRTPVHKIKSFVLQQLPWIQRTRSKLELKHFSTHTEKHLQLFGKKYTKRIDLKSSKVGIDIFDLDLVIHPINQSKESVQNQVDRFLKRTAREYILPRTQEIASVMSLKFNKITLKQQKSRWGSCSSQGNLNFNWRLVHYPPAIIDYVIIHELAHLEHMNHSPRFWNLVQKYDPAYKSHRRWLKNHGMTVG